MNESARAHAISRRTFLRRATIATAGVSAALIVGEEMWEALDRLAPRRLLVRGLPREAYEASFDYYWGVMAGRGIGKQNYTRALVESIRNGVIPLRA